MLLTKNSLTLILGALFTLCTLSENAAAQNPVNWLPEQLMKPEVLAQALQADKDVPLIINIGPAALIPRSVDVGAVQNKEGREKLATALKGVEKKAAVVVYCGCCPYEHCPNVRPAIELLKTSGFTNYKLLDLPRNIKADWLDKGYPRNKL
jgi:hypothetical protein